MVKINGHVIEHVISQKSVYQSLAKPLIKVAMFSIICIIYRVAHEFCLDGEWNVKKKMKFCYQKRFIFSKQKPMYLLKKVMSFIKDHQKLQPRL